MKAALCCFGTAEYSWGKKKLLRSAKAFHIDLVWDYSPAWLRRTEFFLHNELILSHRRGAGLWLWKPFIIETSLNALEEGQFLIYADCGVEIIAPLDPLFELCAKEGGVLLFHSDCPNSMFCKKDAFMKLGCDTKEAYSAPHLQASFCVFQKTKRAHSFVQDWLRACRQIDLLGEAPSVLGQECSDFAGHRNDQSLLSLLSFLYGLKTHRDCSQYGNHRKLSELRVEGEFLSEPYWNRSDADSYPTLLNRHRRRKLPLLQRLWRSVLRRLNVTKRLPTENTKTRM